VAGLRNTSFVSRVSDPILRQTLKRFNIISHVSYILYPGRRWSFLRTHQEQPVSKVTLDRALQCEKQSEEMVLIDEGIQIDWSDEQFSNADSPSFETLEPRSNVKRERFVQFRKQFSEMVSIDEGIQIDSSDEQLQNADSPRFETLQQLSNVKIERFVQL
jgi:hypothetical protein